MMTVTAAGLLMALPLALCDLDPVTEPALGSPDPDPKGSHGGGNSSRAELPACSAAGAGHGHSGPGMSTDAAVPSARERGAELSPGQRGRSLTLHWDGGFFPSTAAGDCQPLGSAAGSPERALGGAQRGPGAVAGKAGTAGERAACCPAGEGEGALGSHLGSGCPLLCCTRSPPGWGMSPGAGSCPDSCRQGGVGRSLLPIYASTRGEAVQQLAPVGSLSLLLGRVLHGGTGCCPPSRERSPEPAEAKLLESLVSIKAV